MLDRTMTDNGLFEYTLSLIPSARAKCGSYTRKDFIYNAATPFRSLVADTEVPCRAIRWIEKPFQDDEDGSSVLLVPFHVHPRSPDRLVGIPFRKPSGDQIIRHQVIKQNPCRHQW